MQALTFAHLSAGPGHCDIDDPPPAPLPPLTSLLACGQAQVDRAAEEDVCLELGECSAMASECRAMLSMLQTGVSELEIAAGLGGAEGGGEGVCDYELEDEEEAAAAPSPSPVSVRKLPVSPSSVGKGGLDALLALGAPHGLPDDLVSAVFSEDERKLLDEVF